MLINKTGGKVIAKRHEICESAFSKMLGLMFSSKKRIENNALVFVFDRMGTWSLHMWFVPYQIDVLFLDGEKRVVELKKGFRPFSCHSPREKSKYVIELQNGAISRSNTKIDDVIIWG